MGKITTNAPLAHIHFCRRELIIAEHRLIANALTQPALNGADLIVARLLVGGNFVGHLDKAIRFAVAAGKQIAEHGVRQILYFDKRRARGLFNGIHSLYIGRGGDGKGAGLAQ